MGNQIFHYACDGEDHALKKKTTSPCPTVELQCSLYIHTTQCHLEINVVN